MLILNFDVNKQTINLKNKGVKVASDSINYLVADFNFLSDDWGQPTTATFTGSKSLYSYNVILGADDRLKNNQCFIPYELLQADNIISVSLFCGDNAGDKYYLHTSVPATFKILKSGYTEGQTPQPPTPDVYTIILSQLKNKADKATTLTGYNITDAYNKSIIDDKFKKIDDKKYDSNNIEVGTAILSPLDGQDIYISDNKVTYQKIDKSVTLNINIGFNKFLFRSVLTINLLNMPVAPISKIKMFVIDSKNNQMFVVLSTSGWLSIKTYNDIDIADGTALNFCISFITK